MATVGIRSHSSPEGARVGGVAWSLVIAMAMDVGLPDRFGHRETGMAGPA